MATETVKAYFESAEDVPVAAFATLPKLDAWRDSDAVQVVTAQATTLIGGGVVKYALPVTPGETYTVRIDGDPLGAGQTKDGGRYAWGSVGSVDDAIVREAFVATKVLTKDDHGNALTLRKRHYNSKANADADDPDAAAGTGLITETAEIVATYVEVVRPDGIKVKVLDTFKSTE